MILHYELWNKTGKPEKEAEKIILLHGMGGTGALWRPIASGLEDLFAVMAPDQRGHGKSRVPSTAAGRIQPQYTPPDFAQDIIETLDTRQFHPTWVIGHSMGVRTATAFAHLKSEWVKGLVLVDLGFSGVAGGGLGTGLADFLKNLPMEFDSRDSAREFLRKNCPDPSIAQYLMAVSVKTPEGPITFPFDRGALIQTIHAARDVSLRNWIKELGTQGMPILILRGATSQVWTHEEFEKERDWLSAHPSIIFEEVPDTGHGLPFEKRIFFVDRIKKFFRDNQP